MKIAIQGHSRKKEVIQLLESLGGVNKWDQTGGRITCAYYIDTVGNIYSFRICGYCGDKKIYTLEEFKKEFPFKIGDTVLLKGVNKPYKIIALEWYMNKLCYKLDNGLHYAPETLTTYKEMKEERNIKLTFDKAKEWYKKGGELKEIALQAFSEKELNPLPRSWEELCENYPIKNGESYIDDMSDTECFITGGINRDSVHDKNICPSQKSAEAHLALIQLEQLRDCWRQGWKPTTHESVYAIKFSVHGLGAYNFVSREFLSFPTREMAEEFLKCFKDLIEQAGDLI